MLIVEDDPYMAEAIRDGLRLEAIAADIAADSDTALELLSVNAYDVNLVGDRRTQSSSSVSAHSTAGASTGHAW